MLAIDKEVPNRMHLDREGFRLLTAPSAAARGRQATSQNTPADSEGAVPAGSAMPAPRGTRRTPRRNSPPATPPDPAAGCPEKRRVGAGWAQGAARAAGTPDTARRFSSPGSP